MVRLSSACLSEAGPAVDVHFALTALLTSRFGYNLRVTSVTRVSPRRKVPPHHNKIHPAMKSFAWFVAIIAVCGVASAQSVLTPAVLSPTAPTDQDLIQASVSIVAPCVPKTTVTTSGNVVTLTATLYACAWGPPPPTETAAGQFGPLPAGSYFLDVYWAFPGNTPNFAFRQPFVVTQAPAPVPAFHRSTLVALVAALLALGLLLMRQVTP